MATSTLAAEGRVFDPLEPAGAAELFRRMDAAEPRRVRRTELEGHVGLTDRELYELGCTPAPLTVRSAGGAVAWRVAIIAGALLAGLMLAYALLGALDAVGLVDFGDDAPLDAGEGVGLAVLFLACAYGGLALVRRGVDSLRTLAAKRRRTVRHAALHPADDPHGRATVAVVRGPGMVRVQLLWVRGDPAGARFAEVRTLAERRIEEDDGGRAEDAVAALSELALRAERAHDLHRHGVFTWRRRSRRRPSAAPVELPEPLTGEEPADEVGPLWAPEPLTDAGQAELARRLCLAGCERWSAAVLEPLTVTSAAGVPREAPPWPQALALEPPRRRRRSLARAALWGGIATFVIAMFTGENAAPTVGAVAAGCAGLAVALAATLLPRLLARRRCGARLARAARAAAAEPPQALEQGLPGTAGIVVVARGQGRIALVHVRPAPDDGRPGDLEARTIASRAVVDDDLDALGTFCAVADEARLRSQGVGRSMRLLGTLLSRLGRVPARAGEPPLRREPLAWAAVILGGVLVAASVKHTLVGTWFEDGVGMRVLSYAWWLLAAYIVLAAARRVRDPFAR